MKCRTLAVSLCACLAPGALGQTSGVHGAALARLPLARAIAADPEVLKALRAKNASGETLAMIQARDRSWTTDAQRTLREGLLNGPCAERLRALVREDASIVEVILMDVQGANACLSRETSDYWQGDEAKFQRTFGVGNDVFVDEPALDASTGTYAIQLSLLISVKGEKLGALTLSLRVRKQDLGAQ
jgi:hypothetical protein